MQRPPIRFAVIAALVAGAAHAQEIPRNEYLKHLPLGAPRLVQQSPASAALHLFGDPSDPGYRDVDPTDGIDDRRHAVLEALAVRFAPYLVQNTTNIPVNFDVYMENRGTFPLFVDTWDVSGNEAIRVSSREINFSVLGRDTCEMAAPDSVLAKHPRATTDAALEDCKLRELLDRYSPLSHQAVPVSETLVRHRPTLFDVLFFNFPGDGGKSWKRAYAPEYEQTPAERRPYFPHAYVHPFIRELAAEDTVGDGPAYELILQYWFFYPTNDSGMNHEGDWEHINVVVSPRSLVERPLARAEVERILDGTHPATDDAADPLVIRRVDYYFHELVWQADFSRPNVYLPRDAWNEQVKSLPQPRFREAELWHSIRHLAYVDDDETIVNTHPFGYIGSDNKGLNQALVAPGGKNRDSHGTFPFPGTYANVGPGGTTDRISVYVDSRDYLKKLREGRATTGPEFKRGRVIGLADPDRLRIVPDWERIAAMVQSDARARREWGWMLLPIHWGYPATKSPFSGVLEHYNTGNVAPVGPSFNSGWNASGATSSFSAYEPHTIPAVFPLGPQDSFRNDLGFLNLTFPLLFNLPPLDFATRIVAYPVKLAFGRRDPVYYPKEGVPFRFVGLSSGVSIQKFDEDFRALALDADQMQEFVGTFVVFLVTSGVDSTTTITGGGDYMDDAVSPFLEMAFYIGSRFTSQNLVRNARTTFGLNVQFNNLPDYSYSAELNYWEYAGSLRYSLSTSRFQPFLKAGYGWSWYRLENIQANGVPFQQPTSAWIKPTRIWPNTWHLGAGIEYIPWKRIGTFTKGLDLAFRAEYNWYTQTLGVDLSGVALSDLELLYNTLADVPGGERATRNVFTFGVTASF